MLSFVVNLYIPNPVFVCRILAQLEDDIAPCEAEMESRRTNLAIMDSKERQYEKQYSNCKVVSSLGNFTISKC